MIMEIGRSSRMEQIKVMETIPMERIFKYVHRRVTAMKENINDKMMLSFTNGITNLPKVKLKSLPNT